MANNFAGFNFFVKIDTTGNCSSLATGNKQQFNIKFLSADGVAVRFQRF